MKNDKIYLSAEDLKRIKRSDNKMGVGFYNGRYNERNYNGGKILDLKQCTQRAFLQGEFDVAKVLENCYDIFRHCNFIIIYHRFTSQLFFREQLLFKLGKYSEAYEPGPVNYKFKPKLRFVRDE